MSFVAWFFTVYGVIGLAIIRPLAGHLAWRMHRIDVAKWYHERNRKEPTGEQWFGAIACAVTLACVWPAIALWFVRFPAIGAEREAQMEAREQRIKEAERELGITR